MDCFQWMLYSFCLLNYGHGIATLTGIYANVPPWNLCFKVKSVESIFIFFHYELSCQIQYYGFQIQYYGVSPHKNNVWKRK